MKFFVGIPNMGYIRTKQALLWLAWAKNERRHSFRIFAPEFKRPIPAARNLIVRRFLENDDDLLLMMDADIVPKEDILDLHKYNRDIIAPLCGTYQQNRPMITAYRKTEGGYSPINQIPQSGIMEVDAVGTGCIMIQRRVLEAMKPPYFSFRLDDRGDLALGEDLDFCERAKGLSFKIFIHSGFYAQHYKEIEILSLALLSASVKT